MTTYNFPPTSRYYGLDTLTLQTAAGPVIYLERRLLPDPGSFSVLQTHAVAQDERLDIIALNFLGDPQAFWRIADPNAAMNPFALTATPGRVLVITLPQGIPGTPNA